GKGASSHGSGNKGGGGGRSGSSSAASSNSAAAKALAKKQTVTKARGTGKNLRNRRCGECPQCLSEDCKECKFCLDMPKYGGPGHKRQVCIEKRCVALGRYMRANASSRTVAKAAGGAGAGAGAGAGPGARGNGSSGTGGSSGYRRQRQVLGDSEEHDEEEEEEEGEEEGGEDEEDEDEEDEDHEHTENRSVAGSSDMEGAVADVDSGEAHQMHRYNWRAIDFEQEALECPWQCSGCHRRSTACGCKEGFPSWLDSDNGQDRQDQLSSRYSCYVPSECGFCRRGPGHLVLLGEWARNLQALEAGKQPPSGMDHSEKMQSLQEAREEAQERSRAAAAAALREHNYDRLAPARAAKAANKRAREEAAAEREASRGDGVRGKGFGKRSRRGDQGDIFPLSSPRRVPDHTQAGTRDASQYHALPWTGSVEIKLTLTGKSHLRLKLKKAHGVGRATGDIRITPFLLTGPAPILINGASTLGGGTDNNDKSEGRGFQKIDPEVLLQQLRRTLLPGLDTRVATTVPVAATGATGAAMGITRTGEVAVKESFIAGENVNEGELPALVLFLSGQLGVDSVGSSCSGGGGREKGRQGALG
ncbi:unnamed protein product, partial [Choristocarpus tenellus]